MDSSKLAGKVALVTGGSRGIGRAICLALADAGADLAINYVHDAEAAEAVAADVRARGRHVVALPADMGSPDEAVRVVADAVAALGRLDILVYNAGICPFAPFLDVNRETYERTRAVNLDGAFYCGQAAAQHMVEQGDGGKIVFVTSIGARIAAPMQVHYNATKAGLDMLGRGMARELGTHHINVNMVGPAAVVTDINREVWARPDEQAKLSWLVPLNRFGQPEDVAHAVVFLCSPESDFITGESLYVDGGYLTSKK